MDSQDTTATDELLATRVATAPGLVRAGASCWDHARTPIHALSMESAYADSQLLRDLGARGGRLIPDTGVEVVVGAETAGVPLAASISLRPTACSILPSTSSPSMLWSTDGATMIRAGISCP